MPRHWIGAGPRFKVADLGGGKRLHKPPQEAGLQRAAVFIGPPSLSGYTIEADLLFTKQGRRAGDLGLINQGYTLDLMGKKQELQLRTWASELEKSTTHARSPAEPDVWYRMKLRVDVAGRQGHRPRQGLEEGRAPSRRTGRSRSRTRRPSWRARPGIYGDSATDLYYDNLTVKVNE